MENKKVEYQIGNQIMSFFWIIIVIVILVVGYSWYQNQKEEKEIMEYSSEMCLQNCVNNRKDNNVEYCMTYCGYDKYH